MPFAPLLAAMLAASALSDPPLPSKPSTAQPTTSAPEFVPPDSRIHRGAAEEPAAKPAEPDRAPAPRAAQVAPAEPAPAPAGGSAAPAEPVSGALRPTVPHLGSLLGGETLGPGGTVIVVTGGYSTLSASFGQGLGETTDYGALLELDWTTTEVFAGGLLRHALYREGPLAVAFRARAGFYGDLGSTWSEKVNRDDAGVQLQPGAVASWRVGGTLLSAGADLPVNVTFSRGGGSALGLRGTASFETAVVSDFSAGLRAGVGVLWSSGGAPFAPDSPRALYDMSLVLTYGFL